MASSRKSGTNEDISTYGNATRDYEEGELSTWEQATDINCVTGTTSPVLECYDDAASFNDHDNLDGATCNATYFRIIRPAAGQGHDGTPNNGFSFFSTVDAPLIKINEDYTQIQDLIGKLTINSGTDRLIFGSGGSSDEGAIVGCIAFNGINTPGVGIVDGIKIVPSIGENFYAIDCLSHNNDSNGFVGLTGNTFFYNCTSTNNTIYGISCVSGTCVAKNCCSTDNTNADWSGTITTTTCTTEGVDSTGWYANVGGDDFHLTSSGVAGNGTDLSGDGDFAFDDDIDSDTRVVTWDIGFDEYIVIGGVAPTGVLYGPLVGPMGGPI